MSVVNSQRWRRKRVTSRSTTQHARSFLGGQSPDTAYLGNSKREKGSVANRIAHCASRFVVVASGARARHGGYPSTTGTSLKKRKNLP